MRRSSGLIINADDLGIHPSINAGILSAYQKGVVSSSSLLMTTVYREETIREYVLPGIIPTGIHLCLTLGKAVAPASRIPDLVDDAGNFVKSAAQFIINKLGSKLLDQIETEFDAQLALARDCGFSPTHADSHQHIHMNPAIFSLLEKLLPRYGITRLRMSRERLSTSVFGADLKGILVRKNPAKWAVLRWRASSIRPKLTTNDEFFGVMYSGIVSERAILSFINRVSKDHVTEICIHPGFPAKPENLYYSQSGDNEFICSQARQHEHDLLTDPRLAEAIHSRGVRLQSFNGVRKS